MANPGRQVVLDEEVAHRDEKRLAQLEEQLHKAQQKNEGLTREL